MLSSVITSLQATMSHQLAQPLAINSALACLQSDINGEPVEMRSWAWQSEHIRFARLTHLHTPSRVQLFNFTIYPAVRHCAAMFASDWVVLQNKLRIGVIDAMPFFQDEVYTQHWVTPFAPLHAESLVAAPVYVRTADWSYDYLSPHACLASQLTDLTPLVALWQKYLDVYLSCLTTAREATVAEQEEQIRWQKHYNQTHLAVELKRNPLLHYFGQTLGTRYLEEFLFSPILSY